MADVVKEKKKTLKELRVDEGLSQPALAKKVGVTSRTIINWESSVKKLRLASYVKLEKLADALEVSVDDIFLDNDSD